MKNIGHKFSFLLLVIIAMIACTDDYAEEYSGINADGVGTLHLVCRIFNGTTYVGAANYYLYVYSGE